MRTLLRGKHSFCEKGILEIIKGSVICETDDDEVEYASTSMIPEDISGEQMIITSIFTKDNKIVLYFEINPVIKNNLNANWVKEHIKATGVEPGFF